MIETVSEEIRSFVTFALAMKPGLTMRRKADTHGPHLTLTISTEDRTKEEELASLEPLLSKYKPLKSYLNAIVNSEESVASCRPTTNFYPNVHYRLVRVTGEQYRIAKEVAARLDRIQVAHEAKDIDIAKQEYDSFHQYLSVQRSALVAEFKGTHFSNASASYGASHIATDDDCSGAVIFVVVEVFICV